MYNDLRKNGMVGVIAYEVLSSDGENSIHFSEWWNGEGLDITLERSGQLDTKISLHMDDMAALVTAFIATGMVSIKECKERAKELIKQSEEQKQRIKEFRQQSEGV